MERFGASRIWVGSVGLCPVPSPLDCHEPLLVGVKGLSADG